MSRPFELRYPGPVEEAIEEIARLLDGEYGLAPRSVALLLLQGDEEVTELVAARQPEVPPRARELAAALDARLGEPVALSVATQRASWARKVASEVMQERDGARRGFGEVLGRWAMRPLTGLLLAGLVLVVLYEFVGVFAAQTVVDWTETRLFEGWITPWVNRGVAALIPWPWLQELLAFDYGLVTLGLRYAAAIILPIVGAFFLFFSVLEDSGYLPRLALLLDRVFKGIGLSGRAVIPMVLGVGCDTMATVVTRTLESRRERVIATLLLALAIPCSAQLGVILAILSGVPGALAVWAGVVAAVLLLTGFLASRLMPGERPLFYTDIPPMRLPRLGNVLTKTYARMQWYFLEVLPVFLLASVLIWAGRLTGLFQVATAALEPVVRAIGLPAEAAVVFLYGFFRRDYGAAGLFDLQKAGALASGQLVVAAVTLTLFIPCIAQFSVMWKERGPKTALAITAFIFPFAFAVGWVLSRVLAGGLF
ncbi:ferrous iron transporter B [Limnochorda pilosa]|uniref:Ferrous iron transporter B n=1 Tax=Limnochorda pilosa TaxID=1555112 RepID=A0A0K2SHL0_LIMPI|nr:ferrous iron transporter B [Limnochorda pilosa]